MQTCIPTWCRRNWWRDDPLCHLCTRQTLNRVVLIWQSYSQQQERKAPYVLNIMYYRDECFFTQYSLLSPLKSNNSGESCR